MPTPYPDPFSGLATGLQQGFSMGLARRQQALAEQEQAQKIQAEKAKAVQQEFENAYKKAQMGREWASNTNLPKVAQIEGSNAFIDFTNKYILPEGSTPIPRFTPENYPDFAAELAKRLKAVDELNADFGQKRKMVLDLMAEYSDQHQAIVSKSKMFEDMAKQQEGFRQGEIQAQTLNIPSDDPRYVGMIQGDDKTRALIAKEMEAPKAEYKERPFPIKGGKIQQQFSNDGGLTWHNLGEPYDRHKPSEGGTSGKGDKTNTDALKVQSTINKADLIIGKVDEAINQINWASTGLIGDIRSTMPGRVTGSGAYDLRKTIDTIKANVGFEQLQAMRDASKTGGALGQVAVKELDMLQSTIASLDAGQDDYQLMMNLKAVKKHYEAAKEALLKSGTSSGKTIIRTGTDRKTGKKVIQYSDGSVEYGN